MAEMITLDIAGYHGERVPNTFWRQEKEAEHIAVILPGIGYTCQMPLLFYATRVLQDQGADVLWVEYNQRADFKAQAGAELAQLLNADVGAACQAVLTQRKYRQITIIGKSLGTLAMGALLTTDPRLAQAKAVWLTPLLSRAALCAQIISYGRRSLLVIGTADGHYDPAPLAEIQTATHSELLVIAGANHGMEIAGDVLQSLRAMEQIMQALQTFLSTE
ncbi:hypothetical protein EPA93_43105 [Ktedonosporobacter rubrisoli]|uniref:Alpha/beta hydrolase n=1 Tax=Ktedonosporobacter rubrisoli TaxID=2509675 RepID=A0A4P6K2Z7_KTERU|nr:hypothetical protein [Ktedonosporobacter rubrisoli]QBD82405.1 hypothetical protein EPA93_43105 [Ktedonosporobacter rubrisoli]